MTALLLRAPVAMSRALGFKTPDDLGLNPVRPAPAPAPAPAGACRGAGLRRAARAALTRVRAGWQLEARVQAAAPAVSRLGTKVWYWGAEAYTLSSAAGVRAAKLTAAASVNATKAAGTYGKRFGKLALRGANTGLNRTAEASVALGKATAEASVALGNKISQGSAQAWGLVEGGAANVSSAIAQAWEKAELPSLPALFSKSSPAAAKDRSANPFGASPPAPTIPPGMRARAPSRASRGSRSLEGGQLTGAASGGQRRACRSRSSRARRARWRIRRSSRSCRRPWRTRWRTSRARRPSPRARRARARTRSKRRALQGAVDSRQPSRSRLEGAPTCSKSRVLAEAEAPRGVQSARARAAGVPTQWLSCPACVRRAWRWFSPSSPLHNFSTIPQRDSESYLISVSVGVCADLFHRTRVW